MRYINFRPHGIICISMFIVLCSGCTRVAVHKDPGPLDKGVRFYRPKPYLFITPGPASSKSSKPALTSTVNTIQNAPLEVKMSAAARNGVLRNQTALAGYEQSDGESLGLGDEGVLPTPLSSPKEDDQVDDTPSQAKSISISMLYMPDFAEEYSIQLRPGLGIGELNIKLDAGWQLTSVGIKTDQQTDEIIKSTADLISSLGSAAGGLKSASSGANQPCMQVLATNVPFGFYEAVVSTDNCGRKRLFGWRYVGFMPFQACPIDTVGVECVSCSDPNEVYGLVLGNDGVLRFEALATIPRSQILPPTRADAYGVGEQP